jgi:hypothetical protein
MPSISFFTAWKGNNFMVSKRLFWRIPCILALFVAVLFMPACFGGKDGFVRSASGGDWTTFLLSEGMTYDRAFGETLDILVRRFQMEMISKDSGYLRTQWIYTWNTKNKHSEDYRTRVIINFSADRTRLNLKAEAERKKSETYWERGFDTRLLETMKQDIQGVVAR